MQSCQNLVYRHSQFQVASRSLKERIIGWGFCDNQNNQDRGKGYQMEPKAETDNLNDDLIILDVTGSNLIIILLHVERKK